MRGRFFQFGVRQFLLLVATLSLIVSMVAPALRNAYHAQRLHQARKNLVEAVRDDDVQLAQRALASGADANATIGRKAESLLHYCIIHGQVSIVALLLEHGADVSRIERHENSLNVGGTPLYAAIGCDQPSEVRREMARILIRHGADVQARIGNRGLMDVAIYRSDPSMAEFLQQQGLPYGAREMAAFNQLEPLRWLVAERPEIVRQRFAPIYAARPGQEPTLLGLALRGGHRDVAKFLIEQGTPLDTLEGQGQTLLHLAVRGGDPELISLLVACGLDVNAKDEYEDTPLTDRVGDAPPDVITALIEAGADVNSCRWDGKTALHLAVARERSEVIQMLLAAGADASTRDKQGKSPLDLAREKDSKIANLLPGAVVSETSSDSVR